MSRPRVATQVPEKRNNNFNEVSLGFSKRIALEEARRCPQCSEPVCMEACPLKINIPGFIRMLREGNISQAYEKIKEDNCLPSICGRICSAPCEEKCVLNKEGESIAIRALERYVSDFGKSWRLKKEKTSLVGKRVVVVGSGPCGLTAAYELVKKGYQVTLLEALDKLGGVLRYGVPEFRVPKKVLDGDINEIRASGVDTQNNSVVGQILTVKELLDEGYNAVLLATGAGIPKFKDVPGINLGGVYYGEEFLMRANLMKTTIFSRHIPTFHIGEKVVVVGAGNTALDCARVAKRFGKDVTLVFRRTEDEMRVRMKEKDYAKEEGITFEPMIRPIEVVGNNNFVRGIKCIRMDYAESDAKGKWELIPVPDSEFTLEADTVIFAVGHKPNLLAVNNIKEDIKLNRDETVKIDDKSFMTSLKGVFAAGNVICNSRSLIDNMASGKEAAEKIDEYLR